MDHYRSWLHVSNVLIFSVRLLHLSASCYTLEVLNYQLVVACIATNIQRFSDPIFRSNFKTCWWSSSSCYYDNLLLFLAWVVTDDLWWLVEYLWFDTRIVCEGVDRCWLVVSGFPIANNFTVSLLWEFRISLLICSFSISNLLSDCYSLLLILEEF